MKQFRKARAACALIISAGVISGCGGGASNSEILNDILSAKSTGAETSGTGHALCLDRSDLIAFIGLGDVGSGDADKTREAQRHALLDNERCTFIQAGVHYDVDAEGREIFHTPHGTLALWPAP